MKITRYGGGLILALIAAGCSGGGGHNPEKAKEAVEELRDFARRKVKDPARSEKLVVLVDAYEKQIGALNAQLQEFLVRLQALNADYDATREAFQKLGEDYETGRKPLQAALLDTVQAMKAAATPEEWKGLAKLEADALQASLQRERTPKKD